MASLSTAPGKLGRSLMLGTKPRVVLPTGSTSHIRYHPIRAALKFPASPRFRAFNSAPCLPKGLSPESADPQPKPAEPHDGGAQPAQMTAAVYNNLADEYLEQVAEAAFCVQETRDDVDVEFEVGALLHPLPSPSHPLAFPFPLPPC